MSLISASAFFNDIPPRSRWTPFALFPGAQVLVRALTRQADDVAQLPLGDANPAWDDRRFSAAGQLQQGLGQPNRQAHVHEVLDLLAGPADAGAEDFNALQRDIRFPAEQRDEIASVDHRWSGR